MQTPPLVRPPHWASPNGFVLLAPVFFEFIKVPLNYILAVCLTKVLHFYTINYYVRKPLCRAFFIYCAKGDSFMIAVLKQSATNEQIEKLTGWLESRGLSVHMSKGYLHGLVRVLKRHTADCGG